MYIFATSSHDQQYHNQIIIIITSLSNYLPLLKKHCMYSSIQSDDIHILSSSATGAGALSLWSGWDEWEPG